MQPESAMAVHRSTARINVRMADLRLDVLLRRQLFNPTEIVSALNLHGIIVSERADGLVSAAAMQTDEELTVLERALRPFLRSTQVNEDVFRVRLGTRSGLFFTNVLPALEQSGVVEEVEYRGGGMQRRFRLGVAMEDIQAAFAKSKGRFEDFLHEFK